MAVHSGDSRDEHAPHVGANQPAIIEKALRSAVSDRVGATRFALWFGGDVRLGLNRVGDSIIVRVPDLFIRDWIERHYTPSLVEAAESVFGRRLPVSIQIQGAGEIGPEGSAEQEPLRQEPNGETRPPGGLQIRRKPAPASRALAPFH